LSIVDDESKKGEMRLMQEIIKDYIKPGHFVYTNSKYHDADKVGLICKVLQHHVRIPPNEEIPEGGFDIFGSGSGVFTLESVNGDYLAATQDQVSWIFNSDGKVDPDLYRL